MIHDIEYTKAKDNYLKNPRHENRKHQLKNVWRAEDKFVNEMNNVNEEPMAKVAGKLIQTKKFLEHNNLLDTKNFEGFGKKKNIDPALRLRKGYATQRNTNGHRKQQKGGFVLPAWLAAMLIAGGVKVTGKVIDYISDKTQGKGIDIHKLKISDRKKFLREILN